MLSSCNGTTAQNPPPPPVIGVSVSPTRASVLLGATQQFIATVTNTTNLSVTWNVNGIIGGNSAVGTVSLTGLYTAPQTMPQPTSVSVQAISQADATAAASAAVTVTSASAITVTIAPTTANVLLGSTQQFTSTVSNTNNTSVSWNVNGIAGGNSQVGTVSAAGLFTAPRILPQPLSVSVQAVSQADPMAIAAAAVTITSDVALSVTPASASVELGAAQAFIPHISSAGNPNSSVTWTVTGTSCTGAACGTIDTNGNYIAPGILPPSASVTVTARSVADPSKTATAPVTITSRFTFSISGPASVNSGAAANYTATLTPVVNSNPNSGIA